MKVIQSGNQPWSHECVCHNCKAKLLVEYADLYKKIYDDIYNCYHIFFSCPECLEETAHQYSGPCEKDIPYRLSKIIKSESIFEKFINIFKG